MIRLLPSTTAAAALLAGALFLSATGGAVAGSMITGKQIKDGSLTGKDVKDGSLASGDLAADTRAVLTGPAGPAGPKGATGATGATGGAGSPGATGATGPVASLGYQIVVGSSPTVVTGSSASVSVSCPAGKKAVGAGASWLNNNTAVQITPSNAGLSSTLWFGVGKNTSAGNDNITMSLVCITA
jgi:hypothetical protein